MHVNRDKIGELLAELRKRSYSDKGSQPELSLGCFHNLRTDNTETCCERCRFYELTCSTHLKGFEIRDNPFEKHREEVYRRMLNGEKLS